MVEILEAQAVAALGGKGTSHSNIKPRDDGLQRHIGTFHDSLTSRSLPESLLRCLGAASKSLLNLQVHPSATHNKADSDDCLLLP